MLGTTTVSSRVVATLEKMYVCLGLTVTEIKIKKVQKQGNKNIRNVKDVGMACKKVCKQGRGKDVGMRLCIFTFTFTSYLLCILFGMQSLYIF